MNKQQKRSSWIAFGLFYLVLILIVTTLDFFNHVLRTSYWGMQFGLITVGVGIFLVVGMLAPDLPVHSGVLLAFTVGVLTIIPAVLMGLGQIPGLWPQYFYIAFGMAAGSFLTFVFLRVFSRVSKKEQIRPDSD